MQDICFVLEYHKMNTTCITETTYKNLKKNCIYHDINNKIDVPMNIT